LRNVKVKWSQLDATKAKRKGEGGPKPFFTSAPEGSEGSHSQPGHVTAPRKSLQYLQNRRFSGPGTGGLVASEQEI
jgi:hypothetical protein